MVGATLRIQDSLQAARSRFFAEITRVHQLLELTSHQLQALNWSETDRSPERALQHIETILHYYGLSLKAEPPN